MTPAHLLRILALARPIVASASAGFQPQHRKADVLAQIDAALAVYSVPNSPSDQIPVPPSSPAESHGCNG